MRFAAKSYRHPIVTAVSDGLSQFASPLRKKECNWAIVCAQKIFQLGKKREREKDGLTTLNRNVIEFNFYKTEKRYKYNYICVYTLLRLFKLCNKSHKKSCKSNDEKIHSEIWISSARTALGPHKLHVS